MMDVREKERIGELISRIPATRKPLHIKEGGLCQLRSKKGVDPLINRHYAIGGPGYDDLERSLHSRRTETTVPFYCRFDIFEYGQIEGNDCVRRLSWMGMQFKVTELQHCRRQNLSAAEADFLSQCFLVRGRVNTIYDYEVDELFCSNQECATGEGEHGMYPCRMKAAPEEVVKAGQVIEFIYHTGEQSGRLLSVLQRGTQFTYNFTPKTFITRGGFGPVQIYIIA